MTRMDCGAVSNVMVSCRVAVVVLLLVSACCEASPANFTTGAVVGSPGIPKEVVFAPKEKPVSASRRSVQVQQHPDEEGKCPQPAYPINKATYCSPDLIRCSGDDQCSGGTSVCCFNGCIFTCMVPMDEPLKFDWTEETANRKTPLSGPGYHFEGLPVRYDDPNVRVATGDDAAADECHLSASQYQTLQDFRHHDGIQECFCNQGQILCKVGVV